jgi:ribonuclease VapC
MVLRARLGAQGVEELYRTLEELSVSIAAFDGTQAERAVAAFSRFGKGMGHRAHLNFGDCAVYALSSISGEPLLATGNDFAATDLRLVAY